MGKEKERAKRGATCLLGKLRVLRKCKGDRKFRIVTLQAQSCFQFTPLLPAFVFHYCYYYYIFFFFFFVN
jgi:hypothetical protein